jgi:hypothetical protein
MTKVTERDWRKSILADDAMPIIDTLCENLGQYNPSQVRIPCNYRTESPQPVLQVKIAQSSGSIKGELYELELYLVAGKQYKSFVKFNRIPVQ